MTLQEKLTHDMRSAQKAGERDRAETLRFLLSELHNREIEKRSKGQEATLSDTETVEVLRREMKKRREAIDLYRRGGREDLLRKEEGEARLISEYLPASLGRNEIEAVVSELVAAGSREFGPLMKQAMERCGGRADGKTVAEIVREKLQ